MATIMMTKYDDVDVYDGDEDDGDDNDDDRQICWTKVVCWMSN